MLVIFFLTLFGSSFLLDTFGLVADIHLCIPTPAKEFDMVVSPMTRIPTVRKTLIEVDPVTPWDEFAFSLDGNTRMKETSTMWDLDLRSPTILYLGKSELVTFLNACS